MHTIIAAHVLRDAELHAASFATASPYRHIVVDDFFTDDHVARLEREFPPFERGSARDENGGLGNKSTIERIRGLGPSFRALDDLIRTPAFLALVGRLTGIDDLLYDPWYFGGGTHENRHGQDLDVHVDFNRHPIEQWHRRLNLIVYLNRDWDEAWGGALTLHSDPRAADDVEVRVAPSFNRCVIFETTETSWHGFPPIVLPEVHRERTRRSIALYFYTKERPAEELAGTHSTIYVDRPLPERFVQGFTLAQDDVQELRVLLARRDQHLQRLYDEVTMLTGKLENAHAERDAMPLLQHVRAMLKATLPGGWRRLARRLRDTVTGRR